MIDTLATMPGAMIHGLIKGVGGFLDSRYHRCKFTWLVFSINGPRTEVGDRPK